MGYFWFEILDVDTKPTSCTEVVSNNYLSTQVVMFLTTSTSAQQFLGKTTYFLDFGFC